MPIITTLVSLRCWCGTLPRCCAATQTWPMISAVDRLRLKPCVPVEQNWQLSAQPTCEDTHSVPRPLSGMYTASIAFSPSMPSSHLCVPSVDGLSNMTLGACTMSRASSSLARSALPRSVIVVEVGDVAMVDPLHHLVGAIALLAEHLLEEILAGARDRSRRGWSSTRRGLQPVHAQPLPSPRRRRRSGCCGRRNRSRLPQRA